MKEYQPKTKIKQYEPKVRNDKHILDIGVLVKSNSSLAFNQHGFMVITELKTVGNENFYILYSQKEQRYWELRCWLVNSCYTVEASKDQISA